MFEYISGILTEKTPFSAVIESGGIGYFTMISVATFEKLPEIGSKIKLFIHFCQKEDGIELYGFASPEERKVFRKLITVTRIGPKVAISILSRISIEKLTEAIASGNIEALSKIPKVGQKTAERIVLELRGKIDLPGTTQAPDNDASMAMEALISLGYTRTEAQNSIALARKKSPHGTIDELIKLALST